MGQDPNSLGANHTPPTPPNKADFNLACVHIQSYQSIPGAPIPTKKSLAVGMVDLELELID